MKMNGRHQNVKTMVIQFVGVICALLWAGTATSQDEEAASEGDALAQEMLPTLAELGSDWFRPWERPREYTFADEFAETYGDDANANITEEEWKAQFFKDPRATMSNMLTGLLTMSDDEFGEFFAGMGGLFNFLSEEGGALGANLSAGGEIGEQLNEIPEKVTREEMIDELRAGLMGIRGWAQGDYSRAKPNGETSEAKGFVPHDSDELGLEVVIYTDDYLGNAKLASDLNREALAEVTDIWRRTKENVKKSREDAAVEISKRQESVLRFLESEKALLANLKRNNVSDVLIQQSEGNIERREKEAAESDKEMLRLLSYESSVRGRMLDGADSGYLMWRDEVDSDGRQVTITGKIRFGPVVYTVSRFCDKLYADDVVDDTVRILRDLKKRVREDLNATVHADAFMLSDTEPIDHQYAVDRTQLPQEVLARVDAYAQESTGDIEPQALPSEDLLEGGENALNEADLREAKQQFSNALKQDPASVEAQMGLGKTLDYSGEIDQAQIAYFGLYNQDANLPGVRIALAGIRLAKQDYSAAERLLEEEQQAHPDSASALSMLGTVHLAAGRPKDAQQAFAKAQALDAKTAEEREDKGRIFAEHGQHDRAVMEFQSAVYMNPERPGSWFGMAASYEASGRHDWAIGALERFQRLQDGGEAGQRAEAEIARLRKALTK